MKASRKSDHANLSLRKPLKLVLMDSAGFGQTKFVETTRRGKTREWVQSVRLWPARMPICAAAVHSGLKHARENRGKAAGKKRQAQERVWLEAEATDCYAPERARTHSTMCTHRARSHAHRAHTHARTPTATMHMQEAIKKHENFFKELERQDRIRQTLKKWDVSKSGGLNKDELGWAVARLLSLLCAPLMCKQSLRADLNTCDIVHAGAMLQDLAGGTAPTEEEVCWWESCARWGGVCALFPSVYAQYARRPCARRRCAFWHARIWLSHHRRPVQPPASMRLRPGGRSASSTAHTGRGSVRRSRRKRTGRPRVPI